MTQTQGELVEAIDKFPTVVLGRWPTPIEKIHHPKLGSILVKRDDLSGFGRDGRSGVKARKLEGLLGYMRAAGLNAFYIPLGNVTNLGFDLLALARREGIDLKILVVDSPRLPLPLRVKLFAGIEEHVQFVGPSRALALLRLSRLWLSSRLKGGRPLAVLPSPAHPSAVVGSARGFIEMARQCVEAGEPLPRSVYVASAAGSTAAGFILAAAALRASGFPRIRIVPVQVVPESLNISLPVLLYWTWRFMRFPGRPPLDGFSVAKLTGNLTYGRFNHGLERTCAEVLDNFGITIDPIYGAKSWHAMETLEDGDGDRESDRPPLFWHCGYTPDWQLFSESSGTA
jgi:1-aminocyclopropane-1-carboxylate deaminase/D-cysteine desulfhydrase-like pyridoxal-dependent ACC family enzyme